MDSIIRIRIPSLTGIRGVAALIVLLFHIPLDAVFNLNAGVVIIRNGYYGVDLFFILSGFILYQSALITTHVPIYGARWS